VFSRACFAIVAKQNPIDKTESECSETESWGIGQETSFQRTRRYAVDPLGARAVMTSASKIQRGGPAIRSPAYWSLLGLIIERPDYGYGLLQRFGQEYGDALPRSSDSHIYEGLEVLEQAGLIEKYASRNGRKRIVRYRATPGAERTYTDWLIMKIQPVRLQSRLFARQVAALANVPDLGLEIIEAYERACLEEESSMPELAGAPSDSLVAALTSEQARLAAQAEMPWVNYARARFKQLAEGRR
jgi:DNA-binding PadR family transcriptional regulator